MIAALWSNSNWDDDKGTRKSAIEELEDNFAQAVDKISGGEVQEEVEVEDKFGFFAAGERAVKNLDVPKTADGTPREVSSDYEIDQ